MISTKQLLSLLQPRVASSQPTYELSPLNNLDSRGRRKSGIINFEDAQGQKREEHVIMKNDSAMSLVYDPKKDIIILTLQDRTLRSYKGLGPSLECPGGIIGPNEDKNQAAFRELIEEIGLTRDAFLGSYDIGAHQPVMWIEEIRHFNLILVDSTKLKEGVTFGLDEDFGIKRFSIPRAKLKKLVNIMQKQNYCTDAGTDRLLLYALAEPENFLKNARKQFKQGEVTYVPPAQ